ncbi:hypothetical protein EDEG_02807 [Edhazardia aedis USNM 41457]|uniref:Uncharacterized protein n=1 Tax=Edhazardia aedis (strain USNM 41457) TaxID=1003232 RepID=J9D4S2_EDHAE|nr:hypothetical protein EDEG_02807 [Edhazardia aedis USNM 41457]|eukprot:EJW02811.1 hypothetical protein EDEG_02807 [Edhazardia aedis USNM 41457]
MQTKIDIPVIFQEYNEVTNDSLHETSLDLVNETIKGINLNAISHNKNNNKLLQTQDLQDEKKIYAVILAIALFIATIINFYLLLQAFFTPKKFTASELKLSLLVSGLIGIIILFFACILKLHYFKKSFDQLVPKIQKYDLYYDCYSNGLFNKAGFFCYIV